MTPKKCIVCEKFLKVKEFNELHTKFHNWCLKYNRPAALCSCSGSEIAIKYLTKNNFK